MKGEERTHSPSWNFPQYPPYFIIFQETFYSNTRYFWESFATEIITNGPVTQFHSMTELYRERPTVPLYMTESGIILAKLVDGSK
jgi:hypothetical protein